MSDNRSVKICARVMALPESEVHALLEQVREEFGDRHPKVCEFLMRQFEQIRASTPQASMRPSATSRLCSHWPQSAM
jgi:hypothetical protein